MKKNIIITGASRGIGREIALYLSKKKYNLILIARNEKYLEGTLNLVVRNSPNSKKYVCDISNFEAMTSVYRKIIHDFEIIHVLINNAGIQAPIGTFYDVDFETWRKNFEINFFSTAFLIKLVLKEMWKNERGKIINFSGGGATSPRPRFSAYSVAKTAIVRFTEVLAEEFREQGLNIDINSVAPGAINTSMLDEVIKAGDNAGQEYKEALQRKEKGGTDIKYILELVDFLISEKSDGITGKLISAPWDKWKEEEFIEKLKRNKNIATLRRIDNKYFGEI